MTELTPPILSKVVIVISFLINVYIVNDYYHCFNVMILLTLAKSDDSGRVEISPLMTLTI